MADQAGTPPLAGRNPFVGPRALDVGEHLFGRRHEVQELSYLLSAERVVLLYAPSGAGKSSLVQAGLIPDLQDQFDVWQPARVNREPNADDDPAANRYVLSVIRSFEDGLPEPRRRPHRFLAKQTLTEYRAGRPKSEGAPNATVLIFDQFEEILTVDPLGITQKREFFDQLGNLLHNQRVWALFVLREDFLPQLDPYERHIPTGFGSRFRLDLLGTQSAKKAMQSTAETAGRTFTEPALDQLVQDLATVNVQRADGKIERAVGRHVEPVNLQVVCRQLWDKMDRDDLRVDPKDVTEFGDVTQALAGYYTASVKRVAESKGVSERTIREWFGDQLIRGGTVRGQVPLDKDVSGGLRNNVIAALLGTHLVRSEERTTGTWFELAHDRLIKPIVASNEAWRTEHLESVQRLAAMWDAGKRPDHGLLIDADLVAAVRWAEKVKAKDGEITGIEGEFLARSHAAQKSKNRERTNSRLIKIAGVVAGVLAIVATFQCRAVDQAREVALAAELDARDAQRVAEMATVGEREQTRVAQEATRRALAATRTAQDQTTLAQEAARQEAVALERESAALDQAVADRELAEQASKDALEAQTAAEESARAEAKAAQRARNAQQIAEEATGEANKQRASADAATARETRARYLSRADEASTDALVRRDDEIYQAAQRVAEAYLLFCHNQDEHLAPAGVDPAAGRLVERGCRPEERDRTVLIGLQAMLNRLTSNRVAQASTSARSWAGGVVATAQARSVLLLSLVASGGRLLAAGPGGRITGITLPREVLPWPAPEAPDELGVELGRRVLSVAIHPPGQVLASGDADGRIRIQAVETGSEAAGWPATLQVPGAVTSMSFSADGRHLAAATANGWIAIQTLGGTERSLHELGDDAVTSLLFMPPAGTLVAGTRAGLHRCDISPRQTLRCQRPVQLKNNPEVSAMAFEPEHDWLAVGGADGTIRIGTWDALPEASPFDDKHLSAVNALSFDVGGALLASGGDDGTIRVWPIDDPQQVAAFDEGEGWVQTVVFDPDPNRPLLYSGSANGTVRVWMPHMNHLMSALCSELEQVNPDTDAERQGAETAQAYCETFRQLVTPSRSESGSP